MYEFYDRKYSSEALKKSRRNLKNLYDAIPETEGCKENIAKKNGCGAWCCNFQNPSVFYCEFLNSWGYVKNSWPKEKLIELVIRALRIYINNSPTKGCVFWNHETKLCMQHTTRPFNCRIYAQTPDEDFKPRYEKLKILYENQPNAIIHDQCNLCTTPTGKPTSQQIDVWFDELKLLEKDLGVEKHLMHDGDGGSYRSYLDHILLRIGSERLYKTLNDVRESVNAEAKEQFIKLLESKLKDGALKV